MDDFDLKTDAKLFAPRKTILHSTVAKFFLCISIILFFVAEFRVSSKFFTEIRSQSSSKTVLFDQNIGFFCLLFLILQFAAAAGAGGACLF